MILSKTSLTSSGLSIENNKGCDVDWASLYNAFVSDKYMKYSSCKYNKKFYYVQVLCVHWWTASKIQRFSVTIRKLLPLIASTPIYCIKVANPSFSHKSFHHFIVTRFPNHWNYSFKANFCKNEKKDIAEITNTGFFAEIKLRMTLRINVIL